jgi:glycosyltransferase involved in cell wall biosynthesis
MISIIIPTLNEEKILKRTLKPLRKLNRADYEVIVSDGGSTDRTRDIALRYADRLASACEGKRQTIAEGRNAGAEIAVGEYLVFLDADVYIPNADQFFKNTIHTFEEDPKLVGLTVFLKVFPQNATLSDKFFFSIINAIYYCSNNIFHVGAASGEFQMMRAEVFKTVGGFNGALVAGEDNDLFARLSKQGKTRVDAGLHILHTSRRAHSIGWHNLLFLWIVNGLMSKVLKRSFSKEWTVIR